MSNHRYSKFWWQDWQGDKALHPCSMAARGFWMELLCIAHEGEPYGHVTIKGEGATLRQMAAIANCTLKEASKWLAELEDAKVFSRTGDGVIWSRRMVKDMEATEAFRETGKKGGNPALKRHDNGGGNGGGNGVDNGRVNPPHNLNRSESESEAKAESESPSDAGAREAAPREAKKVFDLYFPEDSRHFEPPVPRTHASTGHMLESTAKQQPYGPVRSVEEQLEALRAEPPTPQPPPRLRPVEPVRTVEEQLAILRGEKAA